MFFAKHCAAYSYSGWHAQIKKMSLQFSFICLAWITCTRISPEAHFGMKRARVLRFLSQNHICAIIFSVVNELKSYNHLHMMVVVWLTGRPGSIPTAKPLTPSGRWTQRCTTKFWINNIIIFWAQCPERWNQKGATARKRISNTQTPHGETLLQLFAYKHDF